MVTAASLISKLIDASLSVGLLPVYVSLNRGIRQKNKKEECDVQRL